MEKRANAAMEYLETLGYEMVEIAFPADEEDEVCVITMKDGIYHFVTVRKKKRGPELDNDTLARLEEKTLEFLMRNDPVGSLKFDVLLVDRDAEGALKPLRVIADWPNSAYSKAEYGTREIPENAPPEIHARAVTATIKALEAMGWTIWETEWASEHGTIDIVAVDNNIFLSFCEVRVVMTPDTPFPEMPALQWKEEKAMRIVDDYTIENPLAKLMPKQYVAVDIKVASENRASMRVRRDVFSWND